MGLDVSHDCWHGAYSSFTRWRNKLAEVAGYEIAKIYPIGADPNTIYASPQPLIDWGHIEDKNYQGEWDVTPADPLIVLIAHSDCDGVIHPEQADLLAARLEELLPLLPDEDDLGHIGNWRRKTNQFINGLRDAVVRGEDVYFH